MPGRNVHLFAAAVALTVAGTSAANAGGFGYQECCAPVVWGCGSGCGSNLPNIIYGTPRIVGYYQPPLRPYGTPEDQAGG